MRRKHVEKFPAGHTENFRRASGRKTTELVKPHKKRLLRQCGQSDGTLAGPKFLGAVNL